MIDPLTVDPETLDLASARYALGEMQLRVQDMAGRDEGEVEAMREAFGLSRTQAGILHVLMSGGVKRHMALAAATLPRALESYSFKDGYPGVLAVHLVRLRKAMLAHGINVHTSWGVGRYLDPADITRIRTMLEERSW